MPQSLLSLTSLPNLHPAVIHFPVVLLPLALLLDTLSLAMPSRREYARFAVGLYATAALAVTAAYWAGRAAVDSLVGVPPQVEPYLARHSDWALFTLWVILLVAVARVLLAAWEARGPGKRVMPVRIVVLFAGILAAAILSWTADLGGGLVYKHGVGVMAAHKVAASAVIDLSATSSQVNNEPEPEQTDGFAESVLKISETGTLRWEPAENSGDPLGSVLMPADETSRQAVTWVANPGGEAGATLKLNGRALLLVGEPMGDVSVELHLDLSDFQGSVGILHHVAETGPMGLFSVSTDGIALLAYGAEDGTGELDRSTVRLLDGQIQIAVSSAGRHLKGMLDGKMVTHGHMATPPDGRCGILLQGNGRVRIVSFHITPLND